MAKVLKIEGIEKPLIIEMCCQCKMNLDESVCLLANLMYENGVSDVVFPNVHCWVSRGFPENCPLPNATEAPADVWPDDENHRLGPNGERLIAVESPDGQNCIKCFYLKAMLCTVPKTGERFCSPYARKDKRSIHWELEGGKKA